MKSGGKRLYLLLVLLLLTACSLPGQKPPAPPKLTHFSGIIYGEDIQAAKSGHTAQPRNIAAGVRCNEASATAGADGHYTLAVRQAKSYKCSVSAAAYTASQVVISAETPPQNIALSFGPTGTTSCSSSVSYAESDPPIVCSPLSPTPGTLRGTVTLADSHRPLANATIECWWNSDEPQRSHFSLATTDAKGQYTLPSVAIGPNDCVILGKDTLYTKQIESGSTTTLDIQVCEKHCPSFQYHGGSIMQTLTAYLIFWLPRNHTFDPYRGNAYFEALMAQYFNDLGGTALYNLVTQYWGTQGQIHNQVTLGGVYHDTRAYPAAGTRAHPLVYTDITTEIGYAMRATGWSSSPTHAFFVFTGYNVQECYLANRTDGCTFYTGHHDYCGYHSHIGEMIYAYIPDESSCIGLPGGSPNHDVVADSILNIVSHEQFESVTDPLIDGWYGKKTSDQIDTEVADLCGIRFGPLRADGSNVTLNHGHRYIVQEEWNQRAGRCALS